MAKSKRKESRSARRRVAAKQRRKVPQQTANASGRPRAQTRYVLALDESGQRHIRDPGEARYGFIEGGLLVPATRVSELEDRLAAFKDVFLPDNDGEVKSHEMAKAAGSIGEVQDFEHALAHVSLAFRDCEALVACAFLDKARFFGPADGALVTPTAKGGVQVNQQLLFETLALAFGEFLARNRARGRIVHDELRNADEQARWLADFDGLRSAHRRQRQPIEGVEFAESRSSPLVQMADVVIGLLRPHFEKRVVIRDGALAMLRAAERNGLILNVQP